MGRSALIESLRAKAAQDAEAARDAARREAEEHRTQLAAALEARREELAQAAEAIARGDAAQSLAAARHEARALRMSAVVDLATRLRELAATELAALGREGGEALFAALADELPERDWQRIRVNPAQAKIAKRRFPDAAIEPDESVSGGLEATAEEGRLHVDNTLEARLEAAWPDLAPGLIAEALAERESDGIAA
jgi:vacuolar-type H+-ATPase subunit E/Vma4